MDLSNLKPAVGSVQKKTRIGRGAGSGKVEHLPAVTKVQSPVQATAVR